MVGQCCHQGCVVQSLTMSARLEMLRFVGRSPQATLSTTCGILRRCSFFFRQQQQGDVVSVMESGDEGTRKRYRGVECLCVRGGTFRTYLNFYNRLVILLHGSFFICSPPMLGRSVSLPSGHTGAVMVVIFFVLFTTLFLFLVLRLLFVPFFFVCCLYIGKRFLFLFSHRRDKNRLKLTLLASFFSYDQRVYRCCCYLLVCVFILCVLLFLSCRSSSFSLSFSLLLWGNIPENPTNQRRDERMSVVNESMNGIRIIKLFAWENNFLKKLVDARALEMVLLRTYMFTLG